MYEAKKQGLVHTELRPTLLAQKKLLLGIDEFMLLRHPAALIGPKTALIARSKHRGFQVGRYFSLYVWSLG